MAAVYPPLHPWDVSPEVARQVQRDLAGRVERADRLDGPRTVAGIDLGFPTDPSGEVVARAAVVVLTYPELELVEERVAQAPVAFPYVPGLLSFREVPAGLKAIEALRTRPDLLLVDGHGIAHPRRFGIACHLGVLLGMPTIGCAKSILVGSCDEPGSEPGDWTPLTYHGETLGVALRTRARVKPIYVSVGHRVSLDSAIGLVTGCLSGYRLPEPTRLADRIASRRDRHRQPSVP